MIFDGTLGLNEFVDMGDVSVGFYDLKYWSRFYLVKDQGTYVVFAGLFFGVMGLAAAFFMVPKHVFVEVDKDSETGKTAVLIGGSADRFKSSFADEYSALIEKIEEILVK